MDDLNVDDLDNVTEDEIRKFIVEKKITITCNECGHEHVGLSVARNGLTPTISSTSVKEPMAGSYLNFYWQLVCLSCGHLRMFEKATVLRWKIERDTHDGN